MEYTNPIEKEYVTSKAIYDRMIQTATPSDPMFKCLWHKWKDTDIAFFSATNTHNITELIAGKYCIKCGNHKV